MVHVAWPLALTDKSPVFPPHCDEYTISHYGLNALNKAQPGGKVRLDPEEYKCENIAGNMRNLRNWNIKSTRVTT